MVATGRAALNGVLFKNAEAIEIMRKIDTLVVDKTGTLTEGKPKLVSVITFENFNEEELLGVVGSIEKNSEHPLAQAIVKSVGVVQKPIGESFTIGKGLSRSWADWSDSDDEEDENTSVDMCGVIGIEAW